MTVPEEWKEQSTIVKWGEKRMTVMEEEEEEVDQKLQLQVKKEEPEQGVADKSEMKVEGHFRIKVCMNNNNTQQIGSICSEY